MKTEYDKDSYLDVLFGTRILSSRKTWTLPTPVKFQVENLHLPLLENPVFADIKIWKIHATYKSRNWNAPKELKFGPQYIDVVYVTY